jgi:thiosulfate/3-mercaptopyruvate sulfurtransferase
MSLSEASPLVSTKWLADHLDAPDVRVVDASWHMPAEKRDACEEYRSAHIPGAVFFNIEEICDTECGLPHMLPSPTLFSSRARKLGLGSGNKIVVYDSKGLFSAARVWWMFRVMGHQDVCVLDGGFPKWRSEGLPIEDLPPRPRERHFIARVNRELVRDINQVKAACASGKEQVFDARGPGRFKGEEPEPREGMRVGHIPGSKNVPFPSLLNEDGTVKSPDEIRGIFKGAGLDFDRPVITSCGSGVTACILTLALEMIGKTDVAVYDGSWSEWGCHPDVEVETGPAA